VLGANVGGSNRWVFTHRPGTLSHRPFFVEPARYGHGGGRPTFLKPQTALKAVTATAATALEAGSRVDLDVAAPTPKLRALAEVYAQNDGSARSGYFLAGLGARCMSL